MTKYNLKNLQISEVNTKGLYEDMKKTEDRLLDISVALLDDYPNNKFSQIQGEAWYEREMEHGKSDIESIHQVAEVFQDKTPAH